MKCYITRNFRIGKFLKSKSEKIILKNNSLKSFQLQCNSNQNMQQLFKINPWHSKVTHYTVPELLSVYV